MMYDLQPMSLQNTFLSSSHFKASPVVFALTFSFSTMAQPATHRQSTVSITAGIDNTAAMLATLQPIPTSARMVKRPPPREHKSVVPQTARPPMRSPPKFVSEGHSSARGSASLAWKPEPPRPFTSTSGLRPQTIDIVTPSIFPLLLGSASCHVKKKAMASPRSPARRRRRVTNGNTSSADESRSPSPDSHHCRPNCVRCKAINDDLKKFEKGIEDLEKKRLEKERIAQHQLQVRIQLPPIQQQQRETTPVGGTGGKPRQSLSKSHNTTTEQQPPSPPVQPLSPAPPVSGILPIVAENPLTGLLCGVPLHRITATYKDLFDKSVLPPDPIPKQTKVRRLRERLEPTPKPTPVNKMLTFEDFKVLLHTLVPSLSLSDQYTMKLFMPFVPPNQVTLPRKIYFSSIMRYLAKHSDPTVEHSIRFFFECFDDRRVGYISAKVLSGPLIRAWAENRVVGVAVYNWRGLALAFERAPPQLRPEDSSTLNTSSKSSFDEVTGEPNVYLSLDDFRVVVHSSPVLVAAFSQPLECVLTDAPRFPPKPSAAPRTLLGGRRMQTAESSH